MKIVFIQPKSCFNSEGHLWEPTGFGYLISYAKQFYPNYTYKVMSSRFFSDKTILKEAYNADIVAFSATSPQMEHAIKLCKYINGIKVFGGAHPTIQPEDTLSKGADVVVQGEGELAFKEVLDDFIFGSLKKIYKSEYISDLNDMPFPDRKEIRQEKYLKITEKNDGKRIASIYSSRGCPFNCLTGNTLVNTVEGNIPIKDLVGKKKIGVYTYDPKTKEVFITDAINIRKTDTNRELVRVTFDDGSFIDCTPDHRFLTFKNGNQYGPTKETIKEAKDLKPKESVRAVKFYKHPTDDYITANWGRRKRNRRCRIVMEYLLGRKLTRTERVHHKNTNKMDDSPSNLLYCKTQKIHIKNHPEISERMKNNNPIFLLSEEERKQKGIKAFRGRKQSLQERLKRRELKLGKNNPNYKHGKTPKKSRIKEINHKVVKVEYLKEKQDVYDLEVPSTHWFFANNVLVHNCTYCASKKIWGRRTRFRSAENIVKELNELIRDWDINFLKFSDDTFTVNKKRVYDFCKLKPNIPFGCNARVDTVDYPLMKAMKEAGCEGLWFGIESGSQKVLDIMKKGITLKQAEETFKNAKKLKISTRAYFMIGNEGETEEDIKKTIKFIEKIDPDMLGVTINTPYPGSKGWKPEFKDINWRNVDFFETKEKVWGNEFLSAEDLKHWHNLMLEKFKHKLAPILQKEKDFKAK